MKQRSTLVLTLLCLVVSCWLAARPSQNVKFCRISIEDGLSQNTILSIFQDSRGFMWFGTQNGLNRYDGYDFKVYSHKPSLSGSISNNFVYSILEAPNHMLWIGTGEGLNQFNPSTEKFTCYRHHADNPNSLSHNDIRALCLDSKGALWIGTLGGGLNRFDPDTKTFIHFKHKSGVPHSLSHDSISAVIEDGEGNFWIGTLGGGFNRFNPLTGYFTHYHHDANNPNSLSNDQVSCMTGDDDGNLWLGTWGGGLNRFNPDTSQFTIFLQEPENPNSLSNNTIFSLLLTAEGKLWIGTKNGLNCFDPVSLQFTHYYKDPTSPDSLSDSRILSMFQDRTGETWIGTAGSGINWFDCGKKDFSLYRNEPGNPDSLSANNIYAFYEDEKDANILWVGTKGGGLNRFDRTQKKFESYKKEPGNPGSLGNNEVNVIFRDSSGVLWIGTYGGGLFRFIENKKQFIPYTMGSQKSGSLSGNFISCIYEDRLKVLWIGTMDGGLNRFDRANEWFTCYQAEPGNPHSLSNNFIRTIHEDPAGILWIGTQGGGINRFDRTTGCFTHYRHKPGDPNSLSYDIIFSFHQDRKGIFWIGTAGSGLNRFDPAAECFIFFTDENGLPDNIIYGILEDNHGNLWLSTNRGLSKFNPVTRTFRNFDVNDGLQSNEFNFGAAYKSKNGEMFFGGVNGFNVFYPDNIRDNLREPAIVITDFKLFNKSVPVGKGPVGKAILSKSIMDTDVIRLSFKESVISFEYTALNYKTARKNQYAYIMEGFEERWNYVGTRRFATYTNLSPGDYIFRVKGSNNDGIWNNAGRSLKIIILPPFWRSWWFITVLVLSILSMIFTFHQLRIRKERMHKKILEAEVVRRTLEVERERRVAEEANLSKSQFLARMSHEIRTPLNGVLGFIEMLMDTDLSDEQSDYVNSIHTSGQVLLTLINDILDFSKIEAGQLSLESVDFNLEMALFEVCHLIRPRVVNKPVEIICRIDHQVPAYVKGDPGRFRQVLVNLMGNAAKFTQAGEIELSLAVEEEEEDRLELHTIVRDTGIGIPTAKLNRVFDVFQQADGSITREYGGSGLGLPICKQVSNLMAGDVWVESEENKGSIFHFTAWMEKSRKEVLSRGALKNFPGKKVLIIDDNANSLEVLTLMLNSVGMDVTPLSSGEEGAAVIQKAAALGDPFHICILDIQMPVLNGLEVARQIRQLPSPASNLPLLALTSSTIPHSNYFNDAGFSGYLPKPAQRQKLLEMFEGLLELKETKENKKKDESIIRKTAFIDEVKCAIHILLAEDNLLNQKLARYMLTSAGYHLELAINGKEAVEKFSSQPEQYDLILMDIQMPFMDGKEATRVIREKGFTDIPIIAMTAQTMKGDREKCLEVGMNDFIPKPIKREAVIKIVQKWALKRKRI